MPAQPTGATNQPVTLKGEEAEMQRRIEAEERQENAAATERQARANEHKEERVQARQRVARLEAMENRQADGNNPRREVGNAG